MEITHFDYSDTVNSPIGPVLSLRELGSFKTCAFAGRREPRDPVDVAAFIAAGFTPQQLIEGAKARDPGLQDEDYAEAALWVDSSGDEIFTPDLEERGQAGAGRDVAWMRRMLAAWPREPRHLD